MKTIIVSGCAGLVGRECVTFFNAKGYRVAGIDNNMREYFFGKDAATNWVVDRLKAECGNFRHYSADIRDNTAIENIFKEYGSDIAGVIHTAAQPSHDWAAREVFTDFTVNANGTLVMLENFKKYAPAAAFIFTSTNKVYGDTVNGLPLEEQDTRYELPQGHRFYDGVDETMSIDHTRHSLFGVSKASADLLVQEYGRYFNLNTAIFRAGCITGSFHNSAQLHGFLHYLMKCVMNGRQYTVFGYKGKQVRDNIHSYDLVSAFYSFLQAPSSAAVYNIGGGRVNSCSILEAAGLCEKISGGKFNYTYVDAPRIGDHQWWISGIKKFQTDYPAWRKAYDLEKTLSDIFNLERSKGKS